MNTDRRREAENTVSRLILKRDNCIASLVRLEMRLKIAQRKLKRAAAKVEKVTTDPGIPTFLERRGNAKEVTDIPVSEFPIADDPGIPTFLDRRSAIQRRDDAERKKMEADLAARKKDKARVRIEKMKAKQSGETKRVPLSGRAALDFIRNG